MSFEPFVTADTHFGHANIIKHANRPFKDIEENDQTLINNWNEIVPSNGGIVYILGDFAWRDHAKYLHQLHGKKIIILGSHDRMNQDALSLFKEVHHGSAMIQFGNDYPCYCSHTCYRVWEKSHYGVPHLFGHSHGRLTTFNLSEDAGVDCGRIFKKYYPIPLTEVKKYMAKREEEMVSQGRVIDQNGKKIFLQDDVKWLLRQVELKIVEK